MLNPWMLLGVLGLSVPVIIHLIQRQRLRPQMLATLQFLDREDVANAFAPVPRDLLQLLLRLVLLGLFVLLMARMFVGGSSVGPRTMAVILDQSMSMQQRADEGHTLFDRYKKQILELIDGMGAEDKMSLLLVGDQVTTETGYLKDRDELKRVAEEFAVSDSGALALTPTIRNAVSRLRARREVNACVLVFSDGQQLNFQPYLDELRQDETASRTAAFRDALSESNVKLVFIDEHTPPGPNLSIERATLNPERVHVGANSRLTTVVRNRSKEQQTAKLTVFERLAIDTNQPDADKENDDNASEKNADSEKPTASQAVPFKQGKDRTITLEPGESAELDLVHRFESPIDAACWVGLEEDALGGDNRFHLPMRMKDRRQILLVTPAKSENADSEAGLELGYQGADLLSYALNPGEALGQGGGTFVSVKRVTPAILPRMSLPIYSIIVLHGVTELSEQSVKDLIAFVNNGGGVWLIPDREMSPLRFNEVYGPLLGGLAIGQLKEPEQVQNLGRSEARVTHPMLYPLLREEWGSVRDVYFGSYFGLEAMGAIQVALATEGGEPLAGVVAKERGQVFVQLFDCDLETGSLPRSTAFVPMVQQIVATLGEQGEQAPPDVLRVGEVLRMQLPEFRGMQGDVHVAGRQGHEFPLTGPQAEEIRVRNLIEAGSYEVTHPLKKSGRKRWLAVNPVLGEADLTAISDDEQATLWGESHVARIPYAELDGQFARRSEVTQYLIMLVLLAFAAEAFFGAWQSRRGAREERAREVAA